MLRTREFRFDVQMQTNPIQIVKPKEYIAPIKWDPIEMPPIQFDNLVNDKQILNFEEEKEADSLTDIPLISRAEYLKMLNEPANLFRDNMQEIQSPTLPLNQNESNRNQDSQSRQNVVNIWDKS